MSRTECTWRIRNILLNSRQGTGDPEAVRSRPTDRNSFPITSCRRNKSIVHASRCTYTFYRDSKSEWNESRDGTWWLIKLMFRPYVLLATRLPIRPFISQDHFPNRSSILVLASTKHLWRRIPKPNFHGALTKIFTSEKANIVLCVLRTTSSGIRECKDRYRYLLWESDVMIRGHETVSLIGVR